MPGFVFFVTLFLVGDFLSTRFGLPVPGSMIGLCLALVFLAVRGRVDAPLRESSGKFLRYLPLMLVPVGVGIVKLVEAPPAGLWRLEVVLVLSLIIGAPAAAKIMQGFFRWCAPAQPPGVALQANALPDNALQANAVQGKAAQPAASEPVD
jgi:holin-like protein